MAHAPVHVTESVWFDGAAPAGYAAAIRHAQQHGADQAGLSARQQQRRIRKRVLASRSACLVQSFPQLVSRGSQQQMHKFLQLSFLQRYGAAKEGRGCFNLYISVKSMNALSGGCGPSCPCHLQV